MLIHLVKKDFLIVKQYVMLMAAVAIFIPLFMLWRVPENAGTIGFILSVIFSIFMLLQYVLQIEYRFPKAAALLCATPYSRKLLVLSKYIFCLIIYAFCCVSFWIESMIFPALGGFPAGLAVITFFMFAIFLGIYLPVQYKWGYEKTKFIVFIVILASPFVLPVFLKMEHGRYLDDILTCSPWLYGMMLLVSCAVLSISAGVSIRIYRNTDLT